MSIRKPKGKHCCRVVLIPRLSGPRTPGTSVVSSFISYYSGGSQTIIATSEIPPGTGVAFLAFTTPQTTNNTITASASGSAPAGTVDTFTTTIAGVYLIAWNVSITTGNNVTATLDLLVGGIAINSPFLQQAYGGGGGGSITVPASGSFSTNVAANQAIQLRVSAPTVGAITAYSPSISILRVANIP